MALRRWNGKANRSPAALNPAVISRWRPTASIESWSQIVRLDEAQRRGFGFGRCRSEIREAEIPNPRTQIPSKPRKSQRAKDDCARGFYIFPLWDLLGIWFLGFGISPPLAAVATSCSPNRVVADCGAARKSPGG